MARPFEERDIDVLFIASDWDRPEKNYPLVRSVARRLGDARIHVVGDASRRLPGVTYHGFVGDRDGLFTLMGRTRCVACPSIIDAAPGILFEASVLGCNVVASKNCGNWEMCHPELVADPFNADTFTTCIRRAMQRKFADRLDRPEWRCFEELMSVFTALARPVVAMSA
jgi:glycosyltransferase involved in cell wall biosynthesis